MIPAMKTRERNKTAHPGQVVQQYTMKRRTPQEMQEDAARKAAQRQRELEKLSRAAAVMDKQAAQDKERQHQASQPPRLELPFAPRYAADIAVEKIAAKKAAAAAALVENEAVDPDYMPNNSDGESEVSDDADSDHQGVDPTDLDDLLPPSSKKRGRKKRIGREEVDAARIQAATASSAAGGKRKSNGALPEPKKLKTINTVQLLPGWKTSGAAPAPNSQPQASGEDDSMVQPGGFAEDDERTNVEFASGSTTTSTLVKVSMHTSSRITKTARRGGAKKWKLDHLPSPVSKDDFTHTLIPLAKCAAGASSDPWSSLSSDQIQVLVDKVFPEDDFVVGADDMWCGLVSYWLSNCAKEAIELFVREMLEDDPEVDVAALVMDYMTPRGIPPMTPYMWREWNIDPVSLQITKHGRFQNRLVMYTLAQAHFAEYVEIPDPKELARSELPCGALILAIQVVEHALKFWTTGIFVDDKKSSGFFSADNYADTTRRVVGPDGHARTVTVPITSHFKSAIDSLNVNKHWLPIFEDVKFALTTISEKRRCKARSLSVSSAASSDVDTDVPDYQFESDEEQY